MTTTNLKIERGDIWEVRFDPSEGDEIRKIRPAVVMNASGVGRLQLRIVVPITGWQPQFANHFWHIRLLPSAMNGLAKESGADALQVKSISINRFQRKIGITTSKEIADIAKAIAFCIDYVS
jgi:mRNA interferase MazF